MQCGSQEISSCQYILKADTEHRAQLEFTHIAAGFLVHPIGRIQKLCPQILELLHLLLTSLVGAKYMCRSFVTSTSFFCRSPLLSRSKVVRSRRGLQFVFAGSKLSSKVGAVLPYFYVTSSFNS